MTKYSVMGCRFCQPINFWEELYNPTKSKMGNLVGVEMPKYQSHKKVWALKIKSIVFDSDLAKETNRETDGSAIITPEEDGYAPFKVDSDYIHKHKPKEGGYYVQYEGGYKSWSPADAFEEGNTLIKETTFLERLINEEKELGEKIVGLNKGLSSDGFAEKVGSTQFELLNLQHGSMITYRRILIMRINDLKLKQALEDALTVRG